MDRYLPAGPEIGGGDAAVAGRRAPLADLRERLGERAIVLVGLPGAGKTTLGRRLAARLDLRFLDADAEIVAAAGMTIPDLFSNYGEPAFRDGERRVIGRLLSEGPMVLATGGGAYMNAETRARIAKAGISVWLQVDHETLMKRVRRRSNRPLLQNGDPEGTMRRLMEERHPVYALADITVKSHDLPQDRIVADVVAALDAWLATQEEHS